MSTVLDLIKDSLGIVGVISADETPNASDSQLALRTFKRMIESWSAEHLNIFRIQREVFELIPGKGIYTVGEDGDFETARPMDLVGAAYGPLIKTPIYGEPEIPEDDPETPEDESLEIPDPPLLGYDLKVDFETKIEVIKYQKWIETRNKTMQSSAPTQIYKEGTAPLESLHIYPVPSEQIGLVLYSGKQLQDVIEVSDQLFLPPGYEEAIVNNLALRLYKPFGRAVDMDVKELAATSKGNIKRQNTRVPLMTSDAWMLGTGRCR